MTSGQKIGTVTWKRVLTVLAIPLILGGAVLGTYLLAESREGLPGDPDYDCTADMATGARASARIKVLDSGRTFPQITSSLTVSLPLDSTLGEYLTSTPSDPNYRWAMRCALGRVPGDSRRDEYRTALPSVEVRDGRVMVRDFAYRDVVGEPDMWVGVASVESRDGQWIVWFRPPEVLRDGVWTRVTIDTPRGWASSPMPWPPAARDDTRTRWAPNTDKQPVTAMGTKIRPDTRAVIAGAGYIYPYSIGRVFLYSLISAFLAALVYWRLGKVPDGGGTPEFLTRNAEARRLAFPVVAISGAALVSELVMTVAVGDDDGGFPWGVGAIAKATMALAVFAFCAIRWRAEPTAVAGFASSAALVLFVFLLAAIRHTPVINDDSPARLTLKTAFVLLLVCVFAAGFAQAVHTLRTFDGSRMSQYAAWLIAAGAAVVVVTDASVARIVNFSRTEWLSPDPLDAATLCCTLEWYPGELVTDASFWLVHLLAVVLWVQVRYHLVHARDVDAKWAKINLGLVFYLVMMNWGLALWSWFLPVWLVVGAFAMAAFVKLDSPLDRLTAPGGPPVRTALAGVDVAELRRRAKDWQLYVQRAKAAELAYAGGGMDRADYESAVGTAPPTTGWLDAARQRFGKQRPPKPTFLLGGLSPVDVLLSRGPSTEVAGNIRHAVRCALVLGLPVELAIYLYSWLDGFVLWNRPGSYVYGLVWAVASMTVKWFLTGALIGGLWRHLPGKRGPVKVLPLVVMFVVPRLGTVGVEYLTGVRLSTDELVACGLFLGVVTIIGLLMDLATLRPLSSAWSRPRQALMAVYGVQNLAGQLTFLLAQVAATLAIVAFLSGGAEPPAYPSVDPFQVGPPAN